MFCDFTLEHVQIYIFNSVSKKKKKTENKKYIEKLHGWH